MTSRPPQEPAQPGKSQWSRNAEARSRRRLLGNILAGGPAIVALSARSAYAANGSGYASPKQEPDQPGPPFGDPPGLNKLDSLW